MKEINAKELRKAIEELGLEGTEICVHSSVKSFGTRIEGGIEGLLQAFLEKGCTVMVPAFSYHYLRRPAPQLMPERNGIDYKEALAIDENENLIYNTQSKLITEDHMGLFSKQVLAMQDCIRGNHPVNSFAAAGSAAERLMKDQTPEDVYAPFRQLCEDDGLILLMGVGLERATIIHYAEQLAGRKPFIRWANNSEGRVVPVAVGSCSGGFGNLEALAAPKKEIRVGKSLWRCYQARTLVEICRKAILQNPDITRCKEADCRRCKDAIAGGPLWEK